MFSSFSSLHSVQNVSQTDVFLFVPLLKSTGFAVYRPENSNRESNLSVAEFSALSSDDDFCQYQIQV